MTRYQNEIERITSSLNVALSSLSNHLVNFDSSSDWIETAREENNVTFTLAGQYKEFQNVPGHFTSIHGIFIVGYRNLEQFHVMFAETSDVMETYIKIL
ncbi:hypothetical protein [Alkalihalobacillus deserti]|uniref:hypothetical protein n=1 Tax=Alkalihalobacillus deserti TaxID=2879466 RepID=UPI001D14EEE2|nr:hypothetical protein [Alkalihalobacillus deserti]